MAAFDTPLHQAMRRKRLLGRCPCCCWHIPTMGHAEDCSFGFRSRFPIGRDGLVYGTSKAGPPPDLATRPIPPDRVRAVDGGPLPQAAGG